MDLNYFMEQCKISTITRKLSFKKAFTAWRNTLTERVVNIFEWKGLPFPQKEIEILLTFVGFCGITKSKKSELMSVYGSMSGVTNYPDQFTTFTYATPLESGMRTIDKDIVVIDNNQIRLPLIDVINSYATLLAHTDLSLQAILINSRATGLITAKTQAQVDSIASWYSSLENGKTLAVLDGKSFESLMDDEGIKVVPMNYPSAMTIDSYYQIRENLLKSFYSEIGVNSMRDKRERVVEAELDTNLNRILFNIDDMLKSRKEACEKINSIFGTNISVDYNEEIINQSFDTETEETEETEEQESDDNGDSDNK